MSRRPNQPRQPRRRQPLLAKLVVAASCASIAAGIWIRHGLWAGLLASGTLGVIYGLTLIDAGEDTTPRRPTQ